MKILHTADLHLGQTLYCGYSRADEHQHYFEQLRSWCQEHHPDAFLLSGDVFDTPQPGISVKKAFNTLVALLRRENPEMDIIITSGNHDSQSRLQAESPIMEISNITLIGTAPDHLPGSEDWMQHFVVERPYGYIIALPHMAYSRNEIFQQTLDYVSSRNTQGLPVVLMGHLAITGMDTTGHEIGRIQTQPITTLGSGYDYAALGHIHRPQTLGHIEDERQERSVYPAPVARFSGSALHVSCDEKYPHTASLVEIDRHEGEVAITRLRIDELLHFYELPEKDPAQTLDDILQAVQTFCESGRKGYFRLRIDTSAKLPPDLDQQIYRIIESSDDKIRYNPKPIWVGDDKQASDETEREQFQIAEIQQMDSPIEFIEKTADQYPKLDIEEIKEMFREVEAETIRMSEEEKEKKEQKKAKQSKKKSDSQTALEIEEDENTQNE